MELNGVDTKGHTPYPKPIKTGIPMPKVKVHKTPTKKPKASTKKKTPSSSAQTTGVGQGMGYGSTAMPAGVGARSGNYPPQVDLHSGMSGGDIPYGGKR